MLLRQALLITKRSVPRAPCVSPLEFALPVRLARTAPSSSLRLDFFNAESAASSPRALSTTAGPAAAASSSPIAGYATAASSSAAQAPPATPAAKLSAFVRIRNMVKEYGASAIIIYTALWVIPGGAVFAALDMNANFGLDVNQLLTYLPSQVTQSGKELFGFKADEALALSPRHTSALLSYIFADGFELVRLPLTLYTAPKLKAWFDARQAAARSATTSAAPQSQ